LEYPKAWPWVEEAMRRELDTVRGPLVAVSSLAKGADQLLATLIVRRGGEVHAVVPFAGYEQTLEGQDLVMYRKLLGSATVEVLQTPGTEEDAYLAAGKRVVELSELMFAVWNSQPAKGKGGTADIVAYAIERRVPLVHMNPFARSVTRL